MVKQILRNSQSMDYFVKVSDVISPETLITSLTTKLKYDIVHFIYQKKDGSYREAFGTLAPDMLPPAEPSTEGKTTAPRPENPALQKYYDIGIKAWRTFTIANLVAVL